MLNLLMKLLNPIVDESTIKLFSTKYNDNPYLAITAIQKLGLKPVIEATLRAQDGNVLSRPYGSNIQFSNWDDLLLNPVQLYNLPTEKIEDITINTIIGKNAKKPLFLKTPIMITGMSYGGSLSLQLHKALAIASRLAGTSTNTGESTIISDIRDNADIVIGQYNRAGLLNKDELLKQVDAIEIQFGQGAWGGACESTTYSIDIDDALKRDWNLKENEDKYFTSRMPGINNHDQLIELVHCLKTNYDVPIGIKIAGSDYIENELSVITKTECDYIVIDGCEGGTSEAAPTLEDAVGLPTLHSLLRAVKYLEDNNIRNQFDLIIAGGLKTPADFLKALAIGADAIYIGSIAIFAAIQNQAIKTLPESPPTQIALYTGKYKDKLDIELAAIHLSNFIKSCNEEIKMVLQVLGKKDIEELSQSDLVSLDKNISDYYSIRYALEPRK